MEKEEKKTIKIGVCEGRHNMPVDGYIFKKIEDPTDVEGLQEIAEEFFQKLWEELPHQECSYWDENGNDHFIPKIDAKVEIFATGLTVAVIEAVKAALYYCSPWDTIMMHYDASTGNYFPQKLNIFVL